MSNKDTHNLVIDAFGPSICHDCRRSGSELVAFKCESVAEVRSEALPHTHTKDPNNELDELLNQEFACGWCNKYSQLHQSDFDKFKLELTALIDKKVTEALNKQLDTLEAQAEDYGETVGIAGYPETKWTQAVPVSAINQLRAQLSKPKEEER